MSDIQKQLGALVFHTDGFGLKEDLGSLTTSEQWGLCAFLTGIEPSRQ